MGAHDFLWDTGYSETCALCGGGLDDDIHHKTCCDGPGGGKTFANQASLPIGGKVQCIDWCIHRIVAALNAGGVATLASCCGHGQRDGRIDLADGRVLTIIGHDLQEYIDKRQAHMKADQRGNAGLPSTGHTGSASTPPDTSEWELWYAWHPVMVAGKWAWRRYVERTFCAALGMNFWTYREPKQ